MSSTLSDAALARRIAGQAGAMLMQLRAAHGSSGKSLGDAGDAAAHQLILQALKAARPDDAILSEEAACDGSRLIARRVWIIDPLDGTREFGEQRADWAVHVGLAIDGKAAAGAVALPATGQLWCSENPPALAPEASPLRIAVSRSRPPAIAQAVAARLGATLLPMGSAGAKAMAVLDGSADMYLHEGGQSEWDNCAPVAVAQAAGLFCSRIDGAPLVYNRPDPALPDLLICHASRAAGLLDAIAACRAGGPAA